MSAREKLQELIEHLPDDQVPGVLRLVESMQSAGARDPMVAMLLNAPVDDEPLTDEELDGLKESIAAADRGELVSLEEACKDLD